MSLKETTVAYETNWEELAELIDDEFNRRELNPLWTITPESKGFTNNIDIFEEAITIADFYPDETIWLAGIAVAVTGSNLEDGVSLIVNNKQFILRNAHIKNRFIGFNVPVFLRTIDKIKLIFHNPEQHSKIITTQLYYYTFQDMEQIFSPEFLKELEKYIPPTTPSPPDDPRHDSSINIPPQYQRVTLIYNGNPNCRVWFRITNMFGDWEPFRVLENGDTKTFALFQQGRLEVVFNNYSYSRIWDKQNNLITYIPEQPKHNSIYKILLEKED